MKKKFKIVICLLMVFVMLVGLVPDDLGLTIRASAGELTPATSFAGGSGTKTDPYQISNAGELLYLANLVNSGADQSGRFFKLTANISLAGVTWPGIGNNANIFCGTFDGASHVISNLYIDNRNGYCIGLFGQVGAGGMVKALTLQNSTVIGSDMVGGIVGYGENCCIYQCRTVAVDVAGTTAFATYGVGGIVGRLCSLDANENYAYVYQCSNEKNSGSGTVECQGGMAGGIVGTLYCTNHCSAEISECQNHADVKAGGDAGGIVGKIDVSETNSSTVETIVRVSGCGNYGTLKGVKTGGISVMQHFGGIAGYVFNDTVNNGINSIYIQNCWNRGNIDLTEGDSNRTGGIVGYCYQTGQYKWSNSIFRCYSTGNIELHEDTIAAKENNPQLYYFGGIVGSSVGSNLYNNAYVTNTSVCTGMEAFTSETILGETEKNTQASSLYKMENKDTKLRYNSEDVPLIDMLNNGSGDWVLDSEGWPFREIVKHPGVTPSSAKYYKTTGGTLKVQCDDNGYTFQGVQLSSPEGDSMLAASNYTMKKATDTAIVKRFGSSDDDQCFDIEVNTYGTVYVKANNNYYSYNVAVVDAAGEIVASRTVSWDGYNDIYKKLKAGTYKVYAWRYKSWLNGFASSQEIEGFFSSGEYVCRQITVKDAEITYLDLGNVPDFEKPQLLDEASGFAVSNQNAKASEWILIKFNYRIDDRYIQNYKDAEYEITITKNDYYYSGYDAMELRNNGYSDTAKKDKYISLYCNDMLVEAPVKLNVRDKYHLGALQGFTMYTTEPEGSIYFYVSGNYAGDFNLGSTVAVISGGHKQQSDSSRLMTLHVDEASSELYFDSDYLRKANDNKVWLYTVPYQRVELYMDDVKVAESKANSVGACSFTLDLTGNTIANKMKLQKPDWILNGNHEFYTITYRDTEVTDTVTGTRKQIQEKKLQAGKEAAEELVGSDVTATFEKPSKAVDAKLKKNRYVDENGETVKNTFIKTKNGKLKYVGEKGRSVKKTFIAVVNKKTGTVQLYYANRYGYILRNRTFKVNGKYYYAGKSGKIMTGGFFKDKDGKLRYAKKDGSLAVSCWKKRVYKKYHFDSKGYVDASKKI